MRMRKKNEETNKKGKKWKTRVERIKSGFFYQLKKNVRKAYFEKFSVISRFLVQHFSQGLDCKIKNVKISLTNTFSRWFYVDVANTFLQKCLLALFCRLCLPLNFSATKQKKSHQKSPKTRSNITRLTLLHLPPQTKTSVSLAVKTTRPFSNPNPGGSAAVEKGKETAHSNEGFVYNLGDFAAFEKIRSCKSLIWSWCLTVMIGRSLNQPITRMRQWIRWGRRRCSGIAGMRRLWI